MDAIDNNVVYMHLGIGTKDGKFEKKTNFFFRIVCAVTVPSGMYNLTNGFVYRIRTSDGVTR